MEGWFVGSVDAAIIPWQAWLAPLFAWSLLIGALYWMLACLGVMLRAQWTQREALAFPLLRLPLAMIEGAEGEGQSFLPFFRVPTAWIGFGVAVVIQGLHGFHNYFPDVPMVPTVLNSGSLFTEAPWNQMGPLHLRVIPMVVGLSFLVSSEVALSLWFFYLLHKFEMIGAYYLGLVPASLPEPVWTRGFAKSFRVWSS